MSSDGRPVLGGSVAGAGVLVVGGASGLGEGTVRALHARGAHVTVADRDAARAAALAEELGAPATAVPGDVSDEGDVQAAIASAESAPEGLRVAVVCAGIGAVGPIVDEAGAPHPLEEFERTLRINLVGTFNVLRLAARSMRANDPDADGQRGVVVLTGSLSGLEGAAGEIAYAASKGGVHALTLPAARELAPFGVRVNTIAPGSFATAMMDEMSAEAVEEYARDIPFPRRFGRPDEFASLVEQLVDNHMLNGVTFRIDGAFRNG